AAASPRSAGAPPRAAPHDRRLCEGRLLRARRRRSALASAMSGLRGHLEDYLVMRRALGFKLERTGALLAQFVAFVDDNGADVITSERALAWARLPKDAKPIWVASRLEVVRRSARHVAVVDPRSDVIPTDLFAVRVTRRAPYLYAPEEIAALMEAAS